MRVYLFDPGATTALPTVPPVGIPAGMPFVLDAEGRPVGELNRWLRSLPTAGVPAPKSWTAYAGDLVAWLRFLRQRDLDLLADVASLQDAVAAYHADRRMGDLSRRLAPSSWNRAIAAIARFYEWAHAEGLIRAVPFRYRVHLVRTDGPAPRVLRHNLAKESQPRAHVTVRWLEEDFLRLFLDVGLAGLLPDGEPDAGFRGREAGRGAMERLLAGSPLHTVGRLGATSLAREARVSRQDLYRTYRNVLDEFRDHLERLRSGPAGDRRLEASAARLREITERAARYRAERDAARGERDANASRIIYLTDQNRQLHEALGSLRGVVALFSEPTAGPAVSSPM